MNENISNIDYKQVMEYALEPLIIHSQLKIIYVNRAAELFFRASKEDIIGASPLDIFQETSKSSIEIRISSAYEQPAKLIEERIFRMDGTTVDVELYCHPVTIGDTKSIQTYVRDITERKKIEKQQEEMSKEIYELSSTPVPLMEKIAVLPLIGSIDEIRGQHLLHHLPINAQKQSIECLIIDFSSIYDLDDIVTEYIFKVTRVLSMIGVHSIMTGLRPELAIKAIKKGINFESTPTMPSVKEALVSLGFNYNKVDIKFPEKTLAYSDGTKVTFDNCGKNHLLYHPSR